MTRASIAAATLVCLLAGPALAAGSDSPFGSHMPYDDTLLDLGRQAGVAWTRSHDYWIPFYWRPTEPEPGKWVWADEQVADVRARGYQILGMLGLPPGWAAVQPPPEERPDGYIPAWQTRKIQAWENYVYETVSHYRGQVHHWEVWNEPNCDPFFAPRENPGLYIVLLEHAYKAAKRADPDCVILAPSVASLDLEWIELVLRLGVLRYCDVFSIHAYLLPPDRNLVQRLEDFKALLRRHRSDKPIWITEVGWFTGDGSPAAENEKANNHVQLDVISLGHGIERVFSYPFVGGGWGFVRDEDKKPLPLFHAYRTMTRVLEGARPSAILSETPLLWAYLFERDGEGIAVLWSEAPTQVELPAGAGPVRLVERDGRERTLRPRDGWLSVDLRPEPVYLIGVDGERMRALTRCRIEPDYRRAVAGEALQVTVEVANPGSDPAVVTVRPACAPAWRADPLVLGGRVGAGERRTFSFAVTAPQPEALAGSAEVRLFADVRETTLTARRAPLDFDVDLEGRRLARVRATVDVAPDYGFIREWLVVGPFDASDRKGLDRAYGPEQDADPDGSYLTWDGPRGWQRLRTDDVLGMVDLSGYYDRSDEVCAFALCYVHSAQEQPAEVRVGRNDEMAVILGGRGVWRKEGGRRLIPDDEAAPVTLPAGTTPLLLKVCNWGGEWGFAARVTAPGGAPLSGVRVSATPEG